MAAAIDDMAWLSGRWFGTYRADRRDDADHIAVFFENDDGPHASDDEYRYERR